MSRHSPNKAYGHSIRRFGNDFEIAWVVDFYYASSRLRHPRGFSRITDERGARRFCKLHDLEMPTEFATDRLGGTMTQTDPLTFADCLAVCINTPDLVSEFNRLSGAKLGQREPRNGIEAAIDDATGYAAERDALNQADMHTFAAFVYEAIWTRI